MGTLAQVEAGRKAKRDGHTEEETSAESLSLLTEYYHYTDGGTKTKRDILCDTLEHYFSKKSVSKEHTQCHLTSWDVWCTYFNITGELREWFGLFFGTPHEDVSNGAHPQHRVVDNDRLNKLGVKWFNDHKMETFDAIVRKGIYQDRKTKEIFLGKPVNRMIWHNKITKQEWNYLIKDIVDVIEGGYWRLAPPSKKTPIPTTLWFIDANGNKLFHVQMKGSGEKFNSSYHSLMFHIHRPQVNAYQ